MNRTRRILLSLVAAITSPLWLLTAIFAMVLIVTVAAIAGLIGEACDP